MVLPAEVAAAAHKILCEDNLVPRGLRKPHDYLNHLDTCIMYAERVNDSGLSVSGEDVANAILITSGWDGDKPETWRHPHPDKVIQYLSSFNG